MRSDNPKTKAEGLRNLIHLSSVFVLANGTSDWLKDFIMGREIHYDDLITDQLFKLVGGSRYLAWKVRDKGPVEALAQYVQPVQGSIISRAFYDLKGLYKASSDDEKSFPKTAKNLRSFNFIPFVGKPYYWWFGGGFEKNIDQQLDHYKEVMEDRSLDQAEIADYVDFLNKALAEGIISGRTYKRRLRGIK